MSGGARRRWVPFLLLAPCLGWVAFFFLAPLALMWWGSLAARHFSFAGYGAVLASPLTLKIMANTVKIAALTTVLALGLGYPVAYALTMAGPRLRALILVFVLTPYWVDVIVRSFSWMILLGDNGLINRALLDLGLVARPLPLLYGLFAVLLGMVQIMLPLAIVTLFGAMLRIERTVLAAARIHGAGEWRAFRTVFLPLSLPGVYGAGLLVFIIGLGFFVTPALLGSPHETMIAQSIMLEATQLLDWAQVSTEAVVLLVLTTAIAFVYNRYFSLDRLWGGAE